MRDRRHPAGFGLWQFLEWLAAGVRLAAAAIKPINSGDAPKSFANSGNTGVFDMVELNIANPPAPPSIRKGRFSLLSGDDVFTVFSRNVDCAHYGL